MSDIVSEHIRSVLARSLPMVRQHRDEIVSRMEVNLRAVDGDRAAVGQSEVAAMVLTELLVEQAGRIARSGRIAAAGAAASEHRALGIDGRHYSRFGDALVPILKDVLGARVPREVPASWCDAFWAVIRAMQPREALVDA